MSTNIRSSKETISVTPEVIQKFMPPRIESSRKGDNGIVLVVGGSKIYHGAPLLSSLAALRAGAISCLYCSTRINCISNKVFFSKSNCVTFT